MPQRARLRDREHRSAARPRPRPWGCRGCRGLGGRGLSRSDSSLSALLWVHLLGVHPLAKSLCGRAQGQLWIDMRLARLVYQHEQPLAYRAKGFPIFALGALRRGMLAGRCGPALQLARVQQCRQVLRDLAEHAKLAARLSRLDGIPVVQHLSRVLYLDLPEHVRVATDQLLAAVLGHLGEIAGAALLEEQRQENHLEEHVAKLVGLLERMRHDRALILLAIPRTLATQTTGERVEVCQCLERVERGHLQPSPRARRTDPRYFVGVVVPEEPVVGVLVCGVAVVGVPVVDGSVEVAGAL